MAPTGFSAASTAYNSITLTWTNSESVPDIQIQRKPYGGTYSTILVVANGGIVDPQSQADTGSSMSSNTRYYYRIRYSYGGTLSDWTSEVNAYTLPKPPTGLYVTAASTGTTAALSWVNPDTYTYIKVYYKKHSDSSYSTSTETLTGTLTTTTVTGLDELTEYDFRIRGYWSTSTLNSVYNTSSNTCTTELNAPTGLVLTSASTTSVKIDWADNSSVEDGYEIYIDGSLDYTTAAEAITYTKAGLTTATEYAFKVRAKKGTDYSSFCTEDTITTGAIPDADAVIGTVTVVSSAALTPTWACAATNETGFTVWRATDDGGDPESLTYTQIGTAIANATSYADTGLDDYTKYWYKVRAYNDYGFSAMSSAASGTTSLDLDTPTALIAEALSSTQIKVSFTVNAASATSHNVERKTSGSAYASIGSTADGTTAHYTDGTCTTDTEYTYRVRAYNSTATTYGDYSSPITKTIISVGTDSIQRNVTYFAMGNVLYVTSDTPQNSVTCVWISKQLDMVELAVEDADKFKTVEKVQLSYNDKYASVPVTISLSVDGGTTWTNSSEVIGTADGTDKIQDFYFEPVTGQNIVVKITSTDNNTGFSFNGLAIEYDPRGASHGAA